MELRATWSSGSCSCPWQFYTEMVRIYVGGPIPNHTKNQLNWYLFTNYTGFLRYILNRFNLRCTIPLGKQKHRKLHNLLVTHKMLFKRQQQTTTELHLTK